ncbi:MAG: NADH:flavin oxidoreductase/NADH oxidase [Betaproteobacteria bacterium]|nr:NADH:flavin oxidoreductase/NADH oxidase [Betaproteobacteria bacterium]
MSSPLLFEPIDLRQIRAKNRIVVSPMCQYSALQGQVNDWHLVHLGKFAQGGAGIVFVEATAVEARGRITHGDLGLWSEAQIPGLARIAEFVRAQGAVPAIQLAHAGRKASMARPWYGNGPLTGEDAARGDAAWATVGPTVAPVDAGWQLPAPAGEADLKAILDAFVAAARRAERAGFDIVELHAAHGYLLHSFLSPVSNTRADRYGGGLENRMRFPLEVVRAVRAAWPAEKPLFTRCSCIDDVQGGWSLEDTVQFARELAKAGADLVDCSSGGISGSATAATKTLLRRVPGFQLPFAERVRRDAGLKTMAVGLILTPQQAEQALQAGRADLIAVGREALFNPNWPLHAALELGGDPEFGRWPRQYGWWLTRREASLQREGIARRPVQYPMKSA